jgi:hypothetical protein
MQGDTMLSYRMFGTPGAARLVVLAGTGAAMAVDPMPAVTAAHGIRVVAITFDKPEIDDPGAYGSQTRGEQTAVALADFVRQQVSFDDTASGGDDKLATVGLIAYREAGDVALRAAALLEGTVDRLALVCTPAPTEPLDRDDIATVIAGITAQTLVVDGRTEPTASAMWFVEHLANARAEAVPGDGIVSLTEVWDRVLQHVAPGAGV